MGMHTLCSALLKQPIVLDCRPLWSVCMHVCGDGGVHILQHMPGGPRSAEGSSPLRHPLFETEPLAAYWVAHSRDFFLR